MELRHLRYLLAVAEHANFTRAAEALHVSQPTLSQQIRQLERTVGTALLDRTGRSVRLTDTGEAFAGHARRALRALAAGERAVLDVHDLSRGTLRFAVTPSFSPYLVGPLMAEFHTRYPAIHCLLRELPQARIESELLDDTLDLGIAFGGPHRPGIESSTLYAEPISVLVGADHPLNDRPAPLPLALLAEHPLALLSRDFATRGHIDGHLTAHHIEPEVAVEANSINALLEIVRRTRLATVLPDATAAPGSRLRRVQVVPDWPGRPVTALRRRSGYLSTAARAFTELVSARAPMLGRPTPP